MRISTRWKLSTLIIANFMVTASVCANQETPGIFIEREFDRSNAMVPGLQSQYRVCADQRELYRKIYLQGGVGWQAIKQTLPEGYNIKEATLPEPNWKQERVGINVEREYFFGDKYAHYQTQNRYEISDKDQCALIKHQDLKIELDDGSTMHIGFAGRNHHPYRSVGKILINKHGFPRDNMNATTLQAWLYANPAKAQNIMQQNPSYIFFKARPHTAAYGAEGVPLTNGRSLAIDNQ